jgi:hypothetical protein
LYKICSVFSLILHVMHNIYTPLIFIKYKLYYLRNNNSLHKLQSRFSVSEYYVHMFRFLIFTKLVLFPYFHVVLYALANPDTRNIAKRRQKTLYLGAEHNTTNTSTQHMYQVEPESAILACCWSSRAQLKSHGGTARGIIPVIPSINCAVLCNEINEIT